MFQTFEASTRPEQGPPRLAALREKMQQAQLDGFLVPRADAHQGEYVADRDARLAWLTGFTGSAGFCVALPHIAGVFVDGRYRLQVRDQVADDFTPVNWPEVELAEWLTEQLPNGGTIAFDPWLHSISNLKDLKKKLKNSSVRLVPNANLVDQIWTDQPDAPDAKFTAYPESLAGETHTSKRHRLAAGLKAPTVLTLPDSIAWLLNIRGHDIGRNPVPHCFAVLQIDGTVSLYAGAGKADEILEHLGDEVRVNPVEALLGDLTGFGDTVSLDPKSCPAIIATALANAKIAIHHANDPCSLPKAKKNSAEIDGSRSAHLRDGAAMARFLAWIDTEAPNGNLTEIDVVQKLEGFRRQTGQLQDISFDTICGAGADGAIVHYRVTKGTNRAVRQNELLLVDSGGQYIDGTTDVTRTVVVGTPSALHRSCFTRVLQGMIAISRARFPKGVQGQHLDALARYPLWTAGLDYDHGTGHGVGSYLCVHEGPQNLSRRSAVALEQGMILSNEPGYYREGEFGIRIENLIVVQEAPALVDADDRSMLNFETLTFVPIDRRLIDTALLSQAERDWIDCYHADTFDRIGPLVDDTTLDWLRTACAPL